MRPPHLSRSQSQVIALGSCNGFVSGVIISKRFFFISSTFLNFSRIILRLCLVNDGCVSVSHYSIFYSACYIFYGVTSVLQPLPFGISSVTFETSDFIVVPRHSRFIFHHFSLLWDMIIHDFSQRGVVLCCHRLHVTYVFITSCVSHCAEEWLLDTILKFLNFNLFVFPICDGFHDCGWLLGIYLADYKCVIRYGVACNWLVQCGIIAHQGDEKIDRVSISVSWHIHMVL